jgi:hypothetical protein
LWVDEGGTLLNFVGYLPHQQSRFPRICLHAWNRSQEHKNITDFDCTQFHKFHHLKHDKFSSKAETTKIIKLQIKSTPKEERNMKTFK